MTDEVQRPSAEVRWAEELAGLVAADRDRPKPAGWRSTPESVLAFVLGDRKRGCTAKFVGGRSLVERCVVALATDRGLMLIGEPGTAKSFLSELLAAAISGDSTLTIQGSAGTTDDQIKYAWNYALLLAEGPSGRALVPAPVYAGMRDGKIVRFEEITRCPLEVQDVLLSILSDRVLHVPELPPPEGSVYARHGFNVVATANTRDRGVNEMSVALKRRFNFETLPPIADLQLEMALVGRQTDERLARAGVPLRLEPDVLEVLVTTFHELRRGRTDDGEPLESPTSVMSTAEAVSVGVAATMQAYWYGQPRVGGEHLVQHLVGTLIQDEVDDLPRLRRYLEKVAGSRDVPAWQELHLARRLLE